VQEVHKNETAKMVKQGYQIEVLEVARYGISQNPVGGTDLSPSLLYWVNDSLTSQNPL
jgi:hypothetical protein